MGRLRITRRAGEKVFIGDAVVEVERVGTTRVVLTVTAPKELKVLRAELVPPGLAALAEQAANKGRG